jgi:uncharacterized protein YlaI
MPCKACGKNIATNTTKRSTRGSFGFSFSRTNTTKSNSIKKTVKTKSTHFKMSF